MSNIQYIRNLQQGTTTNDMFDNHMLFIHNIQVQQTINDFKQ